MDICVICTDNLTTIDTIMTKCDHKFHFDCLNKWLLIKPRCPCCREDIFDLIDPRTNEKIVYFDEYDENYEYGGQSIITIPNMSITLVYYYVFLKLFTNHLFFLTSHIFTISSMLYYLLFHIFTISSYVILYINLINHIYFYNSSSTLNYNNFMILIII